MTQEKWEALQRKFAPLGATFDEREFAPVRCLRCSAVLVDWTFYCDSCLRNSDAGALEYLKIQEALCLVSKMFLLGVATKTEGGYCSPNFAPEFIDYVMECRKRHFEVTGIEKNLCFKNPDVMSFFRFFVVDGN